MKRILLIEDDAGIREGIGDLLTLEGYRVDRAANGEEGLALLRRPDRPALVIVDLVMPVMNGVQFLERFHQDPRLAGIPAVLMTAAMPPAAALPKASDYLAKPFDVGDLLRLVERHCGPPGVAAPVA